jgi:hypothetical protein
MNRHAIAALHEESDLLHGAAGAAFRALFFLFLLVTIFDPADLLLGLKVPLFLACWASGALLWMRDLGRRSVPIWLLVYVLLIVLIPVASIWLYFLFDGSQPYAGFLLLKSYLFVSLAILIYITRVDVIKYLAVALPILAVVIVLLTVLVQVYPALFLPVYYVGNQFGIFSIDEGRDYGSGTQFFQMYFVTSPLLVVAVAHYFQQLRSTQSHRARHYFLMTLSACAMFLAGTRNNMLIAILLPTVLFLLYSKHRFAIACLIAMGITVAVWQWRGEIGAMFDPAEASNSTKLRSLGDYAGIIGADLKNLLLGRGLGAYEDWTGRRYTFITELTFLEIFRNFGLLMGIVMTLLLLYPVIWAFMLRSDYPEKPLIIAYCAYLVMSMTNPLFFSSMGMLVLASLLARIALFDHAAWTRS